MHPDSRIIFYALIASNGTPLWNYTLGYTIKSQPQVSNGTVYIGASFVTSKNGNFQRQGAVIALRSTVTSPPLPPIQELIDWVLLGIVAFFVAILFIIVFLVYSIVKKKKRHSTS